MFFALGSNGSGQLGVGHTDDLSLAQPISSTDVTDQPTRWRVHQLAAGGNHTLILCEDGNVRATGNNEDGRCGFMHPARQSTFRTIDHPASEDGLSSTVVQISATWSASILLCADGALFSCGSGSCGELGLGADVTVSPTWQRIPSFPPPGTSVVHLTSSMAHTVAVLSDGRAYGWGKGRKGQIGPPAEDSWIPREIPARGLEVVRAAAGKDFTYVVASSGVARMLGPNSGDRFDIAGNAPARCRGFQDLAASWGSVYVLSPTGQLAGWGRNDREQLPAPDLPSLSAVAAGSEHSLGLTVAGNVIAWGWGEHGNCGDPTDDRGDVKGRWNEINVPGPATKVFAGCATSFIEVLD